MLTSGPSPDAAAAARSEKTRILWAVDEKKLNVGDICLKGDKVFVVKQKCFAEKFTPRLTQSEKSFLS